ncbi:hypothetical protein COCC4DRAFT_65181 [Bipolaris maydis ATCC 48331]|uniref:BZIP domain-containing protein n=1 Tax=Cochliobolus heterostrophus (strain C4 / ATCC 48331 / race T) TaxID=665024 RepID=N4X2A5_COCH4|nr:uncharacterized protein COCC4DRAFT_65181 [Bipolaris maydis ATCC 48331]ENI00751.1 hypothetical protein COCC4DRAFT_65181 [Bipolaris maydis ATCC 48331]
MSYQTPPAYSPMSFSSSSSPSSSDTSAGTSAPRTKRARVSAEHTLNRVRENQRRHRARQRDHVASLERKLAETERLLVEARAEIAILRQQAAQRDEYNGGNMESGVLGRDIISITPPLTSTSPQNQTALFLIPAQDDSNNNNSSSNTLLSPPSPSSSPSDPECTTCKTRPPPSPTESTTLCAQAFVLIRQQNFRNLDPHSIRIWLAQGLRRAQREGEGCRVENGALLRLLDFISGV